MRGKLTRRAAAAGLAVVLAGWLSATACAAAPRLLMVSGPGLDDRVLLSDWNEVAALTHAFASGPVVAGAALDDRPSLELALFWNAHVWEPYVREGRLGALHPEDGNQHGRLYPSHEGEPALVDLPWAGDWPRQVTPDGTRGLEGYGVPVAGVPARRPAWPLAAAGVALIAVLAAAWKRGTRRSRPVYSS